MSQAWFLQNYVQECNLIMTEKQLIGTKIAKQE